MKAFTLSSYVIGILFSVAFGALSMGCVAQAGTDEASSQEGLDYTAQLGVQKQEVSARDRMQLAPKQLTQPVKNTTELEQLELKELQGTADPGGNVEDDGDGKEPDPHPWHTSVAAPVAR